MAGKVGISCALLLMLLSGVRSQVCTRMVQTTRPTVVTYLAYDKVCETCPLRIIQKTRDENVPFTQIVTECCTGYMKKNKGLDPSSDNCVPRCEKECVDGQCSPQNECLCFEGYEKHPTRNTCIYKCDTGEIRKGVTCKIVSKTDSSGQHTAIYKHSCDMGKTLNERGECEKLKPDPITCFPPCGNGTCNYGNQCTCRDGYNFHENENPRCVPSCRNCQGTCVAPGNCECSEHYVRRYITADNRDCDCFEDCDTKCYKTLCVLAKSTVSMSPTKLTDESEPPEASEIYVVVKRLSQADKSSSEPATVVKYEEDLGPWLIVFIFTTIIMAALIILVVWEYQRK